VKVVVTGGAGFIGANLCRELLRRHGYQVVVLDDLSTGRLTNLAGLRVDLRIGSVLDPRAVAAACEGADSIVHLAAVPVVPWSVEDPSRCHDANVTGTMIVLAMAREIGAHVVIGTDAAAYHTSAGLDCCVFQFSNVFGPLQSPSHPRAAVIPSFIFNAIHGLPLTIYGDGGQTRDFTFVGSVVDVLAEAVARRLSEPAPVNLAFGARATVNEVVTILSDLLGRRLEVRHRPPRVGDIRHAPVQPSMLGTLFPKIRPVPLPHGLLRTVSWLESQVVAVPSARETTA
jgi:UDP-glucose 4-epimerase